MRTRVTAVWALVLIALLIAGCASGSTAASSTAATTGRPTTAAASTSASTASAASGFAAEPAATIVADVSQTLAGARSFSAQGVIDTTSGTAPVSLEVQRPSSIEMSFEPSPGVRVKVTAIDQTSWLWANTAFWTAHSGDTLSATAISQLADRWFLAPASDTRGLTSKVSQLTSARLAVCLRSAMVKPRVVRQTTVAGQPALELSTAGGAPGQSPGNLYVAIAAPHDLLRFQQTGKAKPGGSGVCAGGPTGGSGTGNLVFSGWNATTVAAPANATKLP